MNDYEEQLLAGMPELTEEQRQRILLEQQQVQAQLEQLETQQVEQPKAPQPDVTAGGVGEPSTTPTPQPEERRSIRDVQIGGELETFATDPRGSFEAALSIPTGVLDFGADLLNMIPNVEIPKVPKFENDVAQSVRELSSIVIPTLTLGGIGATALGTAAKGSKFLSDPLVRKIGEVGFSAGTGAFVDYTVELNQQDDNLAGTLKKSWPRWFGWIPDDAATLDTDSPDVKRAKNVTEGAALGVGTDVLLGLGKLLKATRGVDRATQWVPESEKAKNWFKENLELEGTPEEVVEASAAKRSEALDEIGGYNLDGRTTTIETPMTAKDYYIESQSVDFAGTPEEAADFYSRAWDESLTPEMKQQWEQMAAENPVRIQQTVDETQPIFGYHDLYGYQEQGIRSADDLGIVGASVDAVRIMNNIDSVYGRVGSVVTEGALKYGLEAAGNQETIIRGLAKQLQDAGEYGYKTASGKYISFDQIQKTGEDLASQFYRMDVGQLKTALKQFQGVDVDTGAPVLQSEAYAGVMGAIKKYMDDYMNMDYMRAQAYVGTSMAGQVSDMAQGMRLTMESPAIERAQEQILDRVEFLMAQKGMTSYSRGRALNMLNLWNRMTMKGSKAADKAEATRLTNLVKNENNNTLASIERIKQDAKETVNTLRAIKEEQPELLAPLMMAYELTDGNVNSITRLNNYVKQSLGVFNKAFIDQQPEIPSVVMRGFYSNVYNSVLSAFATPIKAGLANSALLIEKPFRATIGALTTGDTETIRRGFYQFGNVTETLADAFDYMKQVFKRSADDPYLIEIRDDIGLRNEQQLDVLNSFAEAKAAQGEYGPQVMMEIVKNMNDLANHPWLRLGNRSMQAFDGFTQSMIATFEAKGRAFDEVTRGGKLPFDAERADAMYRKVRENMFDEDDLISDDAVKATAGEIALNLDNVANNALSSLIRRAPLLKPFLLFTKTPLNELALSASYTPMGLFFKDFTAFKKPFEEMPVDVVNELLTTRGIEVTPYNARAKYNEIRADLRGRQALGALMITGAVSLFMTDRITGNGHYNRQKQALRRDVDWKPRSIKLPGGKWVSYDNLGPVTNFLALTADVMDNFDSLSPNDVGEQLRKLGFVVASSITEKTMLAGIEPFLDVVRGDVGAINKWSSSFLTSAVVPGSSQLAEISRLMDPGLKEVEMDLFSLIQNRIPFAKGELPAKYDWIDGGEVGIPDNFMARVWNTYMPWKVNGKISPEKQFLIDIEYDARPTLRTNGKGVELTPEERSEITDIMGRDGLFKRGIQRVMQTKEAKQFRKNFKKAIDDGFEPDLSEFESVHILLDRELRGAMRMASAMSPSRDSINRKMYVQEVTGNYLRSGNQTAAREFLDYMENYSK
jgi:hypothetical protein